jgi:hypothetical protein
MAKCSSQKGENRGNNGEKEKEPRVSIMTLTVGIQQVCVMEDEDARMQRQGGRRK